jgi:hypothetical protein
MSEKTKFINAKRRGFLQGTVVAGGAVAAGVATAKPAVIDATPAPVKAHKSAGYRLTDQVRMYYAKARF